MPARRQPGAREAEILAQLWASDRQVTPAEVLDGLGGGLAYNTVMTILTRMWRKGLVERIPQGRGFAYRPTVSEAQLVATRMHDDLLRTADRNAALAAFVSALSARDSTTLRRVLDDLDDRRGRQR